MAKKKVKLTKKSIRTKTRTVRTIRSRTISFFIGIVTVLVLAFIIFQYAQSNNYKQVLGKKTEIYKQDPRVK